jgi:hypothetical protein
MNMRAFSSSQFLRVSADAYSASCESPGMRRLLPMIFLLAISCDIIAVRAQGTWSTAQLKVARQSLAAVSVGNVALFAGGYNDGAFLCKSGTWVNHPVLILMAVSLCLESFIVVQCCALVQLATSLCLMRSTDTSGSNVVDLYFGDTGAWSLAYLSDARGGLAAASVKNVALFAGGYSGAMLCKAVFFVLMLMAL